MDPNIEKPKLQLPCLIVSENKSDIWITPKAPPPSPSSSKPPHEEFSIIKEKLELEYREEEREEATINSRVIPVVSDEQEHLCQIMF